MLRHRLGYLPRLKQSIWVHAESLGEVKAASALIKSLIQKYPELSLMITVQTQSGFDEANQQFSQIAHIAYVPYDWPGWVCRAVSRINPVIFLSVENSLWPARFWACARKNIPVVLINAKIGRRTLKFYERWPIIARLVLKNISHVFAASHEQAERFKALGFKQVEVPGELKLLSNLSERVAICC
ncbi:MAG: glycosyltransferase N-terminal domain-containing protein [Myxococcaceae bacterium]